MTVQGAVRHRTSESVVRTATASERARAFRQARWNTFFVRLFRRVLPLGTLALFVVYIASAFRQFEFGADMLPSLPIPEITAQDLTMKNPHYSGFTKDGGKYEVVAASARQDFSVKNKIELQGISGTLTGADDAMTKLAAETGNYATDTGVLDLWGRITVASSRGMSAELSAARIETKAHTIQSTKPVTVQMNDNRIDANALWIEQKERRALFSGGVTALLHPPAPTPADRNAKAEAPEATGTMGALMSTSSGPVTVTSQKLTVDDVAGRATFAETVVARQSDTEIGTEMLAVEYASNTPAAGSGDASTGGGSGVGGFGRSGDVRAILSPGPLVIRRGDGQTVSAGKGTFDVKDRRALLEDGVELTNGTSSAKGATATFDAAQDLAVLSGGVEISAGPGRSARAATAEFWSKTDRARLSGNVVVSQGGNIIEGGELVIDRQSGQVHMTTPSGTGPKAGRIAARLQPQKSAASAKKKTKEEKPSPLGTFRSDPDAPVTIESARLDVDDHRKTAVFSGDVAAEQGTFKMNASRLTATYSGAAALGDAGAPLKGNAKPKAAAGAGKADGETRITEIRADGSVKLTSAQGQTADGDWATFDTAKNSVVLGGDVILRQGKSVLRGTRLVVDLTSGRTSLTNDGSKSGGGWATTGTPSAVVGGNGTIAIPKGATARGGRPSALFFPQDLKKPPDGSAAGGWNTKTQQR